MTVINNLIRLSRQRPAELTITDRQVRGVAEYFRALSYLPLEPEKVEEISADIRAGRVKLLDIPLRVLGAS